MFSLKAKDQGQLREMVMKNDQTWEIHEEMFAEVENFKSDGHGKLP